jgi:hypothetical protein
MPPITTHVCGCNVVKIRAPLKLTRNASNPRKARPWLIMLPLDAVAMSNPSISTKVAKLRFFSVT